MKKKLNEKLGQDAKLSDEQKIQEQRVNELTEVLSEIDEEALSTNQNPNEVITKLFNAEPLLISAFIGDKTGDLLTEILKRNVNKGIIFTKEHMESALSHGCAEDGGVIKVLTDYDVPFDEESLIKYINDKNGHIPNSIYDSLEPINVQKMNGVIYLLKHHNDVKITNNFFGINKGTIWSNPKCMQAIIKNIENNNYSKDKLKKFFNNEMLRKIIINIQAIFVSANAISVLNPKQKATFEEMALNSLKIYLDKCDFKFNKKVLEYITLLQKTPICAEAHSKIVDTLKEYDLKIVDTLTEYKEKIEKIEKN